MKWLVLVVALSTGCRSETEYGECVGLDPQERKPDLVYKVSVRNAIWSFLAIETIIAPVLWATDFAFCPVAKRGAE